MVTSRLPIPSDDHAEAIVQMALAMQQAITRLNAKQMTVGSCNNSHYQLPMPNYQLPITIDRN